MPAHSDVSGSTEDVGAYMAPLEIEETGHEKSGGLIGRTRRSRQVNAAAPPAALRVLITILARQLVREVALDGPHQDSHSSAILVRHDAAHGVPSERLVA